MKHIHITSMLLPALCATFTFSAAQQVIAYYGNDSIALSNDSIATITSFTATVYEGKTYLKWTTARQHTNGIYIIYRSYNGTDYFFAGSKKGVGVPVDIGIAYYFTDESNGTDAYYKLLHVRENATYLLSDKIYISSTANVANAIKK
jgi:hypothetical protein